MASNHYQASILVLVAGLCGASSPCFAAGASRTHAYNPAHWRWLRGPRARRVARERGASIRRLFERRGVAFPPRAVYLRALKQERELELWARGPGGRYLLIKRYGICAASGELGPKRRQGDGQVPEGFYWIDRFNPRSSFHLSLGINYPNRADQAREARRGRRRGLGGDIFIHGACVSIGCMALTDGRIEEVYLAAAGARSRGQRRVPVHVFPARLDAHGIAALRRRYAGRPELLRLWSEMMPAYLAFEARRRPPRVRIDRSGRYQVTTARPAS